MPFPREDRPMRHDREQVETAIESVCKKCGTPFVVSPGELRFLSKRQWPRPEHCPACLVLKRAAKAGV